MKARDLDLRELLQWNAEGGVIRFGGQRALLVDAVAMGILRGELVHLLGKSGARGVLTGFGYAHGWRTAENMKTAFPWDDEMEWKHAGGRLHTLQGLVDVKAAPRDPRSGPAPVAESLWHDSYEAEQHLLHFGRSEEPTCWTLSGFATGYLSCCYGRAVYCIEERCVGRGDAVCHLVGRFREDWGEEIRSHLPFYESKCLDAALLNVTGELKRVEEKLRARRTELSRAKAPDDPSGMVAQSPAMERAIELASRVAMVDSTVLVTGESGVGKERIARLIHEQSARASGPFVAINCGAIAETLLESELFGHAKGAFTGATHDRAGLFEAASGGTLFLDEIGEVTPAMQVRLLRALQEKEVRRVGENRDRKVDARVVAATNRDLMAEVHAARFRQDLYYRLRVVEIKVPPLRERREDILPLARKFLAEASQRIGRKVPSFTPKAANQLMRHDWPGNVRELENAVERAVVLARSNRIDQDDLPEEVGRATPGVFVPDDARTLAEVEREYIEAVLDANGGNRARASEVLGIGSATLYRKLKEYSETRKRADR